NVTADVIIPMLPLLLKKSQRFLVLSGILVEQEEDVLAGIRKFENAAPKIETDGEWISVMIERSGPIAA
ncbi:MAG: 50S ribosomal protein L11 methyltransferase, partial [Acidobacteria bacterium]|nr:50S ribosomal protein L11 methyltransferase [Acidobacteriota bacterium]